jgi:hypothetical protein
VVNLVLVVTHEGFQKLCTPTLKHWSFTNSTTNLIFFLIAYRAANKSVNISMRLYIIKTLCLQSNSQSHRLFDGRTNISVLVWRTISKNILGLRISKKKFINQSKMFKLLLYIYKRVKFKRCF